jgi:hypothetical protein
MPMLRHLVAIAIKVIEIETLICLIHFISPTQDLIRIPINSRGI